MSYAPDSFQLNGGSGVFIGEAGACATGTPVKTFTYPATEQRICFFSKSYRQVKNLNSDSITWFDGNSPLAASTTVVGVEGNQHQQW